MTDDDTKFERARRERPYIEAFARLTPMAGELERAPARRRRRRTFREIITGWGDVDREHGVPRDGP